jgi:hypothetical protein
MFCCFPAFIYIIILLFFLIQYRLGPLACSSSELTSEIMNLEDNLEDSLVER